MLKIESRLFVGVSCGLFSVDLARGTWTQLHDETLTEVLALSEYQTGIGVIAGCPYGLATGAADELGAARWTFHDGDLTVDQRFINAVLRIDAERACIVGTEGGLLYFDGSEFSSANISDTAVRALCPGHGCFWAGTDTRGIWRSDDGRNWSEAPRSSEFGAVFDIVATAGGILAATENGFMSGDGATVWVRSGPRIRAACVEAHSELQGRWLGGAYPGGLWVTETSGATWSQVGNFTRVMSIVKG